MPDTISYPRKIQAVYTQIVTLAGHKPGAVLQVLEDGLLTSRELVFSRKVIAGRTLGGIYEFEQTAENSFRISDTRYIGLYEDESQRLAWMVDYKAKMILEERARAEKSDAKIDPILDNLAPLRSLYLKSFPTRQRAIEVMVLHYLRYGGK